MSSDGQRTKCGRKIAENFNRMSRAHECYRRQTDRQTDGRRSLKAIVICINRAKHGLFPCHALLTYMQ